MTGQLPGNVMQFARILRRAGLPVGPGKVMTALQALGVIDIGRRDDVFHALHTVFVERRGQSELFRLAFERFWRAASDTQDAFSTEAAKTALPASDAKQTPRRIDEAFGGPRAVAMELSDDAREVFASWSAAEKLRAQDFETMSAAEWAEARRLIAQLRLPIPSVPTRRFKPARTGTRIDMRATFSAMVRAGGTLIDLRRKRRVVRHPPLVVLCDISGSMEPYARMLLHFLHAVTNDRDRVHTFLFGTRLTNVTRELSHRDPDEALARVAKSVQDWSGGTRIGQTLRAFNRLWARRVLGQGAMVLLITDGLDRDGGEGLADEMARLHRSCRRLIWLNPLLRYAAFEPKSAGIRAMLPHVDDFRPAHNLDSLADVIAALSAPATYKAA
jgi:uncharacterized protein with von Willebrand factor type A (vWA) domain